MTLEEKRTFVEQWINKNATGKNARSAYYIWKRTLYADAKTWEYYCDYIRKNYSNI